MREHGGEWLEKLARKAVEAATAVREHVKSQQSAELKAASLAEEEQWLQHEMSPHGRLAEHLRAKAAEQAAALDRLKAFGAERADMLAAAAEIRHVATGRNRLSAESMAGR